MKIKKICLHFKEQQFREYTRSLARFCGVRTQIWFPTRGNPILLRSENALHLRSAVLTSDFVKLIVGFTINTETS